MGRLIDADELHRKLFEIGCHKSKLHPMDVMKMIEEQPTAYDIDKVVEELEKQKIGLTEWEEDEAFKLAIHKAIEIVKQGGVSDDVCEWTSTQINNEWKPSCEPKSTYNVSGVSWFRKCPYCGKKIKVVE